MPGTVNVAALQLPTFLQLQTLDLSKNMVSAKGTTASHQGKTYLHLVALRLHCAVPADREHAILGSERHHALPCQTPTGWQLVLWPYGWGYCQVTAVQEKHCLTSCTCFLHSARAGSTHESPAQSTT